MPTPNFFRRVDLREHIRETWIRRATAMRTVRMLAKRRSAVGPDGRRLTRRECCRAATPEVLTAAGVALPTAREESCGRLPATVELKPRCQQQRQTYGTFGKPTYSVQRQACGTSSAPGRFASSIRSLLTSNTIRGYSAGDGLDDVDSLGDDDEFWEWFVGEDNFDDSSFIDLFHDSVAGSFAPPWTELHGSPEYSGDGSKVQATTKGIIPGDAISAWYCALFPTCVWDGDRYPLVPMMLPGTTSLFAESWSCKPEFADQDNVKESRGKFRNEYDTQEMTVTWKNIQYLMCGNSLVTVRFKSGGQVLTTSPASGGGLMWNDDGNPNSKKLIQNPDIQMAQTISVTDVEVKVHRSPFVPSVALQEYKGCVGVKGTGADAFGFLQDLVTPAGRMVPAPVNFLDGTLIYLEADVDPVITPYGDLAYDYTLHFKHRTVPLASTSGSTSYATWNHFYDPETGLWRPVAKAHKGSDGNYQSVGDLFPGQDFTDLIP